MSFFNLSFVGVVAAEGDEGVDVGVGVDVVAVESEVLEFDLVLLLLLLAWICSDGRLVSVDCVEALRTCHHHRQRRVEAAVWLCRDLVHATACVTLFGLDTRH